jgi:uncharacterized protein with HEPN domain
MNLEKDKVYVEHILECIDKINQYTDGNKQRFISDDLVQDGVLRRLQTMAESTQRRNYHPMCSISPAIYCCLASSNQSIQLY